MIKVARYGLLLWCVLGVVGLLLLTSASGAVMDELKPSQYQKQRQLRQMMDRFAAESIEYEISIKHTTTTALFPRRNVFESYDHKVKVSGEVEDFLRTCDYRFVRGNFLGYLEDPRYSFYTAILLLARATLLDADGWGTGAPLTPLERRDKEMWNREVGKFMPSLMASFSLGQSELYKEQLLFESTPVQYHRDIFSDRIFTKGQSIIEKPVFLNGKSFADAVREFNASGNTAKLLELPLTQENLEVWLYLAMSGPETNRLYITKDFCAWCRKSEPKKNAFLSAVMMGLFTVDGYLFDDEKGTYEPNERGNLLLDYIVEFPIPENATRLKIVMDGGNKTLLENLMKKHDTSQAWQELLKNPVEPKFIEFKQHPRKK